MRTSTPDHRQYYDEDPTLDSQAEDQKELKEELTDRLPFARRKFEFLGGVGAFENVPRVRV